MDAPVLWAIPILKGGEAAVLRLHSGLLLILIPGGGDAPALALCPLAPSLLLPGLDQLLPSV